MHGPVQLDGQVEALVHVVGDVVGEVAAWMHECIRMRLYVRIKEPGALRYMGRTSGFRRVGSQALYIIICTPFPKP